MDRLAELKQALKAKTDEADRISGTFKIEDGKVEVSKEQADEYRKVLGQAGEIKGLIESEEMAKGLREFGDAPATPSLAVASGAGARALAAQAKDLGSLFTESDEFKALIKSGGATMQSAWQIEGMDMGGMWGQKDVYTTLPTGTSIPPRFGEVERDATIPLARRTQRVRDLFPARPTTANLIDYFTVSGFTNNASVVPERVGSAFGLKPQSSLAWTLAQAPVRTIAHWEVAHRNVLADEPALRATINTELLYGLRLAEDYQILQGTGTGEDLLGVLNTTGIQTYAQSSGPGTDKKADAVRRAATRVMLAYYEPTGVVLHPYDWEEIELDKDTQGRYLYSQVAVGTQKVLWRMPVVDTPAIPENTSLVGSFGLGAQLYDRELGNIRIAEQHGDFFLRNAVVILAEERLALATRIPESFVKVTFTA